MSNPTEEAAAIFVRVFEALARQSEKTLSHATRADIGRACELLTHAGDELEDVLEERPTPPRRSPGEAAIDPDWERFEQWRAERR